MGAASPWGPVFFRVPGRHVPWHLYGEGGGVLRSALTCLERGAPGALVFADEESFICPSHVTTQEPTAPNAVDVMTHGVVIIPRARIQRRTSEHPPHKSPESPHLFCELHGENHMSQDQKAVLFLLPFSSDFCSQTDSPYPHI